MEKTKFAFFKFIKYSYNAHKPFYFVTMADVIVQALLVVYNSFSLSIILRYAEIKAWEKLWLMAALVVLLNFIFVFLTKYLNRLKEIHKDKSIKKINEMAALHMTKVPFSYLENSEYLELKERVKFAIQNQGVIETFVYNLSIIVQNILTLLGLTAILVFFDSFLVIVIAIALVFQIAFTLLTLRIQMRFYNDLIPINRKYDYYFTQLFESKNAKDFRMYAVGSAMKENFGIYCDKVIEYFSAVNKKLSFTNSLSTIVKNVELLLIYLLVAIRTIKDKLSISVFSLNISAAISLSQTLVSIINSSIQFARAYAYIVPYVQLMELTEEKDLGSKKLDSEIETVEFKNVYFTYPGTNKLILENISFKVEKGQKISIVGLNGAGKTTLIKLLCRLYQPDSGEILVNNISILDYDYDSYISKISAVFQDYKLFAYSLRDNISIKSDQTTKPEEEAYKVGLKSVIEKLPKGIDSPYGKEFSDDGVELSGGEAQKFVIARALYRDSSLIILDEPTSALDPLAEAEIYENFNNLVENKMAFYISHRMSSSIFCDKILVIDNGKVSDFAPHKVLMEKKESLYYKLFMLQAKNYELKK